MLWNKGKETGLRFNPGLAIIGLLTTGPWGIKVNNSAQKRIGQRSEPGGEGEWAAEALPPKPPTQTFVGVRHAFLPNP